MAKKLNVKAPWMAFIPILKYYLLGLMVKDESKIPYMEIIIPLIMLFSPMPLYIGIYVGFSSVFAISMLLNIAMYIMVVYELALLAKKFVKDYFVLVLILLILFPILRNIIILIMSFGKPEVNNAEYAQYYDNSNYY